MSRRSLSSILTAGGQIQQNICAMQEGGGGGGGAGGERGECRVASPWAGNDTRDTANVLHGVLKQHKVHHSIGLVVLIQSLHSTAIMSSDVVDFCCLGWSQDVWHNQDTIIVAKQTRCLSMS